MAKSVLQRSSLVGIFRVELAVSLYGVRDKTPKVRFGPWSAEADFF